MATGVSCSSSSSQEPSNTYDSSTHEKKSPASPPSRLPALDPSALLEEAIVDGLGRFKLFGDGRVSTLFDDGTVLTMKPAHYSNVNAAIGGSSGPAPMYDHLLKPTWLLCDLLFPDGRTTTVRSTCPIGAEGYVHAAVQFRNWASKPYEVRLVEAEESKSRGEDGIRAIRSRGICRAKSSIESRPQAHRR